MDRCVPPGCSVYNFWFNFTSSNTRWSCIVYSRFLLFLSCCLPEHQHITILDVGLTKTRPLCGVDCVSYEWYTYILRSILLLYRVIGSSNAVPQLQLHTAQG